MKQHYILYILEDLPYLAATKYLLPSYLNPSEKMHIKSYEALLKYKEEFINRFGNCIIEVNLMNLQSDNVFKITAATEEYYQFINPNNKEI